MNQSDTTPKSVQAIVRDAVSSGSASELADHVARGGKIPSPLLESLLRRAHIAKQPGGQTGPQLPDDPEQRKLVLARYCAAYLVWCCADLYLEGKHGTLDPEKRRPSVPKDALQKMEDKALEIVFKHFGIKEGVRCQVNRIIDAASAKMPLYQREKHDDVVVLVHSELNNELHALLDWMQNEYFAS